MQQFSFLSRSLFRLLLFSHTIRIKIITIMKHKEEVKKVSIYACAHSTVTEFEKCVWAFFQLQCSARSVHKHTDRQRWVYFLSCWCLSICHVLCSDHVLLAYANTFFSHTLLKKCMREKITKKKVRVAIKMTLNDGGCFTEYLIKLVCCVFYFLLLLNFFLHSLTHSLVRCSCRSYLWKKVVHMSSVW